MHPSNDLAVDGGRYEDSYVRTPAGWRFQSRVHVPPAGGDGTVQLMTAERLCRTYHLQVITDPGLSCRLSALVAAPG